MSKSPSLRRIKADIRELSLDPSDQYHAAPLETDMFEWHFTIRGAKGTDFEGGVYHGKILLPPEYPFKPPNVVFLTPSGRFETNVKVCLSFSAFHPELWQPAWGIRLILEALISFLPTPADGAIGALDWTSEERKKLAKESVKFRCPICCAEGETCADLLPKLEEGGTKKASKFSAEIEKLKALQVQNHAVETDEKAEETGPADDPKPPANNNDSRENENNSTQESKGEMSEEVNNEAPPAIATPPPQPLPPAEPPGQQVLRRAQQPQQAVRRPAPAIEFDNGVIISDKILNLMLGFFGVFVYYLVRQASDLLLELKSVDGFVNDVDVANSVVDLWWGAE
mmetsp:Transcript_11656/g.26722  ORF Transcript_11656/g.26722 Transcript_11656/m.26722 type:complete len:340 (-) Transcript_11656:2146-3165(-)